MLQRVVFSNAHADYSGGAIFAALLPAPITILDALFASNTAGVLGGAILAWNSSSFTVCSPPRDLGPQNLFAGPQEIFLICDLYRKCCLGK